MPDSKQLLLLFIATVALLAGCTAPEPAPQPNPFVMAGAEGVYLNSFALGQGEFPILGDIDSLPCKTGEVLPESEAREILFKAFKRHGYKPAADYSFHWGKIHVALDGYDKRMRVGFVYLDREDYEKSKVPPDGSSAKGLFYTVKSDSHFSIPELMLLEGLNGKEMLYVALINAHQFCIEETKGGADFEALSKELSARVELYLTWVDARMELRRKEAQKKAK